MNRALILAIMLLVLLVVAAAVTYMIVGSKENRATSDGTVETAAPNENTSTELVRRIITQEEKGGIALDKRVSYRGVDFQLTTAGELDTFHQQTADEGQKYVVLFVAPLSESEPDPSEWVSHDVKLVSSTGAGATLREVKIIGAGANTDSGYLWFTVGNDEHNFRLVFSSSDQEATLDLGF
ncbi:MAG: hypothetical protein HYZ09_04205 [Candidatus Kerfeldbacteria bacterium]|nr:hypothetical protein [Candidatus Kerfeldbacteria bacterium]